MVHQGLGVLKDTSDTEMKYQHVWNMQILCPWMLYYLNFISQAANKREFYRYLLSTVSQKNNSICSDSHSYTDPAGK